MVGTWSDPDPREAEPWMAERGLDPRRLVGLAGRREGTLGRGAGAGRILGTGLLPGVAAGVTALVVFLLLHAVWIVPIWSVVPLGLVIAGVAGVAVGRAYRHVEPHLPGGLLRRWLTVAGGAALVLVPSLVVAWVGEPYFVVVDGARVPTGGGSTVAVRFAVEFLLVTTIAGAVLGRAVTRTRRGTLSVAVAAFALALGPGHNLPFFHVVAAPAAARTAVLLTLAPIVVASAVLVAIDAPGDRGTP